METLLESGLVEMYEQAAGVVEDIGDDMMDCESLRAWDALVYPLLYATGALWSGAAEAMIRSAGQMMTPPASGALAARSRLLH